MEDNLSVVAGDYGADGWLDGTAIAWQCESVATVSGDDRPCAAEDTYGRLSHSRRRRQWKQEEAQRLQNDAERASFDHA
jgi:hypothetical protein